jgi:hypothetical protein
MHLSTRRYGSRRRGTIDAGPDPVAYVIEARRFAQAFYEALVRVDAHLTEIRALPYGETPTALLAAARREANAARQALEVQQAHSATLRTVSPAEGAELALAVRTIDQLVASLEELNPRADA